MLIVTYFLLYVNRHDKSSQRKYCDLKGERSLLKKRLLQGGRKILTAVYSKVHEDQNFSPNAARAAFLLGSFQRQQKTPRERG